ncbi:MAG TPA: HD domain-containing phosphohydrolase [Vicinamibacterales bacterium]|nr:HD domain-containing protein [Gemmatimonadales bacterium]HOC18903.1 HD domain-containing phosphohydrolase [Vicinamibacterales bacterium]
MGVQLDRYHVLDNLLEGCQVLSFDWRYLYVNEAVARHARIPRETLLGRTMTELYPGIDRSEVFAVLRRCMEERTTGHFENEFTYPNGSRAWFELRIEPVPEGLFVLSLDITDRKHSEQSMRRQIERLRSLRAIDVAILGSTDVRVALQTVLEETRKRLEVDMAAIFLPEGPTGLAVVACIGFECHRACRTRLGEGAVGCAALRRTTVVVPDAAAAAARRDVPAAILEAGIEGFCATPLIARGHLVGVLAVARRGPLRPDEDWIGFLESLAGQAAMAIDAGKSYEDLERAHVELALAYDTTIEGWAAALELRDKDTANHTLRVAELTMRLCRAAGMGEGELVHVRRGALLHDIGKMAIPDSILLKEGRLTDEEVSVMQRHPAYAFELLSRIEYLRPALDIPYAHHERWDGSGYPRGLKGEDIPLAARLFAVVDVWDALRSPRPYHAGASEESAREQLRRLAGTHLDPGAVDLFLSVLGAGDAEGGG